MWHQIRWVTGIKSFYAGIEILKNGVNNSLVSNWGSASEPASRKQFCSSKHLPTSLSTWTKNCLIPSRVSSSFLTRIRMGLRINFVVTSSTSWGIVAESRTTWNSNWGYGIQIWHHFYHQLLLHSFLSSNNNWRAPWKNGLSDDFEKSLLSCVLSASVSFQTFAK